MEIKIKSFFDFLNKEKELFQFYIVKGNLDKNFKEALEYFDKEEIELYKFNDLNIEKAREIKRINSLKVSGGKNRIILIKAFRFDIEIQNSLLKTFEEVNENSHIFLFLFPDFEVLETVLSRARICEVENIKYYNKDYIEKFINSDFSEREKMINKIHLDKKKEPYQKRIEFLKIIYDLDLYLFLNREKILKNKEGVDFYKKFLKLKKEAFWRGSNLKNILVYFSFFNFF